MAAGLPGDWHVPFTSLTNPSLLTTGVFLHPKRRGPAQGNGPPSANESSARDEVPAEHDELDRLVPVVYDELRRIAHNRLQVEPAGHTLSTTALVHEAYLKLAEQSRTEWRSREHFMAVASMAMRRVLVDHARRHLAEKRGGERTRVPLDAAHLSVEDRAATLIELDDALTRLQAIDARLSRVVECRFFGGMTEEETAAALGITSRTVRSDWATAKGLLYLELTAP